MFRWSNEHEKDEKAEDKDFPLEKLNLTTRNDILKRMPVADIIKMSLKSMDAAADFREASIRPKNLTIIAGHSSAMRIEFLIDGFRCCLGTGSSMSYIEVAEKRNLKFCSTETITGEPLECAVEPDCLFIYASQLENIAEAVRIFYTHLCHVFKEALETDMLIMGKHADLYPIMCAIRNVKVFNKLEISGHWDNKLRVQIFQKILTETTQKYLTIQDSPPIASVPTRIHADHATFNLANMHFLNEDSLRMFDSKSIDMRSGTGETNLAKLFNFALRTWGECSGFEKLESIICKVRDPTKVGLLTEGLPMEGCQYSRRPAYYCSYKTDSNNEEVFSKFYDLRNSADLINQNGGIGTLTDWEPYQWNFIVWTKQEVENLKKAPGKIREAQQKLFEKVEKSRKKLGKLEAQTPRFEAKERSVQQKRTELTAQMVALDTELDNCTSEKEKQVLLQRQADMRIRFQFLDSGLTNHMHLVHIARGTVTRYEERIAEHDRSLGIIANHPIPSHRHF